MSKYSSFDWNSVTDNILKEEQEKKKGFVKDTRFWKPSVDDKGNATAIIRFIPDQNMTPFIKYYSHNFKYMENGLTKYWIKNCINTFGYDKECPICKKNQEYWNSAYPSDKAISSQRKRKLIYVSNILVIKNPANPDDEGKTFLFSYGQKIYDMIKDKMFPSEEVKALGEYEQYVPFDLFKGANFKLVQVKQGDYPNYDKSCFGKQGPIGTEKQIDVIMEKTYDLSEFIQDDKFPTNEEVVSKLGFLLGLTIIEEEKPNTDSDDDIPFFDSTPSTLNDNVDKTDDPEKTSNDEDEDEYFKNL